MTSTSCISARIQELNDAFREGGLASGRWMLTRGVADLGPEFTLHAVRQVMQFDAFTPDNDPYGEHDFGAFSLGDERLFWKIDYYDSSLSHGSDAPEDARATTRVLTVMLASEY
jgi:hypothetical protein